MPRRVFGMTFGSIVAGLVELMLMLAHDECRYFCVSIIFRQQFAQINVELKNCKEWSRHGEVGDDKIHEM